MMQSVISFFSQNYDAKCYFLFLTITGKTPNKGDWLADVNIPGGWYKALHQIPPRETWIKRYGSV